MDKTVPMLMQKRKMVEERRKLVRAACEDCIKECVIITYKEISSRTSIPHKTLERSPYKDDITYYKKISSNEETKNKEIEILKDQVKYLRKIIKQLNKENHELKTELYYADKI